MPRLQFPRSRWIVTGLLSTAIITSVLPSSAGAQIFGGRVRNWLRGDATARRERIPPDGPVIIERHYVEPRTVEPRIVLPGESEAAVEVRPRYRTDDYGEGVSERGVRESRFSIRRRAVRSDDATDYPAEERTVRELDRRRSVLRAPEDRWQQDDVVVERRSRDVEADYDTVDRRETTRLRSDDREAARDLDREADYSDDAPLRGGERTVRVDRFERASNISPAEDPYEEEKSARDLELRGPRGPDEELVDDLPPRERNRPRNDDRVRPAAAEADDANELPEAVDRTRAEEVDEFDMPRAARDTSVKEEDKAAKPVARRLAKEPAEKTPAPDRRPRPAADEELLPPPPTDE